MWFPDENAINYLNEKLRLPASGSEQDWEIELADHRRIEEFIRVHEATVETVDVQQALVALLVASFEDALWKGSFDKQLWLKTEEIVSANTELYKPVLKQWIRDADGDGFRISTMIEGLL